MLPENRERARTSESNILTSVSGLCHLLAVGFGANDFTSLSIQLFICEVKNNGTCLRIVEREGQAWVDGHPSGWVGLGGQGRQGLTPFSPP